MLAKARLKSASTDPTYSQAIDDLFELPRTFVKRNMWAFSIQPYDADLAALPKSATDPTETIAFPDTLSSKIYYDVNAKKLHFIGAMTDAEHEALKKLAPSTENAYQSALTTLHGKPEAQLPAKEEEFLTSADSAKLFGTTTTPAERFELVLNKLLTYLQATLSQSLVKQKLSDRLSLEAESVDELLLERVASAKATAEKAIADFLDPDFVASNLNVALSRDEFPHLFDSYLRLHKIALVATRCKITPTQLAWILDGGASGAWTDLSKLPIKEPPANASTFEAWERLVGVCRLRDELPVGDKLLKEVFSLAASSTGTVSDILAAVCTETEWDETDAKELSNAFGYAGPANYATGEALRRMAMAFSVLGRLGMSAAQCWKVTKAHGDDVKTQREIARAVIQAARAKYDEPAWLTLARPLRNVLREKQRAALVAYLVTHPLPVTQTSGGTAPAPSAPCNSSPSVAC